MTAPSWRRFAERWNLAPRPTGARPVFLLASGWRCGSTLLQRLVCSSGELLMWGEPYGRANIVPTLTRAAMVLREDWPGPGHFPADAVFEQPSEHWIANLYPPPAAMVEGFGAMLDHWLARPAHERGFERFGLKEVRLQAMDAAFLEWLYPDARFLFLVRNPWDAWSSCKGATWFVHWPTQKVEDARAFAALWLRIVQSFTTWPSDNAMLVRYEDLRHPGFDLEQIREHCGLQAIDPAPRDKIIRGMAKPPIPLEASEVEQIRRVAGEMAEALGYTGPSPGRS
jgi:hypothetical protein